MPTAHRAATTARASKTSSTIIWFFPCSVRRAKWRARIAHPLQHKIGTDAQESLSGGIGGLHAPSGAYAVGQRRCEEAQAAAARAAARPAHRRRAGATAALAPARRHG